MAARYWVGGTDTWDATAGSKWSLTSGGAGGQAVPTTADTVFFNAASGANTITLGSGYNPTISTLTMTGFTGTLAYGSQNISVGGTGTIYTGATTFSVTGTPVINCTNSSATARVISTTATTEANSISFNVTAGTGNFTLSANNVVRNLNFTGFTGVWVNSARIIYGSLTLNTGMTSTDSVSQNTFASTLVRQNITTNGVTLGGNISKTGSQPIQLQDALTLNAARSFTLTLGTLDLNNKTLTTGIFASSNANTRTIAFGTGNITLIGNSASVWNTSTITNFSYTGTSSINAVYSGSTGTRTISTGNPTEANVMNFNITAGSDIVITISACKSLNFTGFSGTYNQGALQSVIYQDLTLSPTMTTGGGTGILYFYSATATQNVTSNGVVINSPIWIGSGTSTNTLVLQDNLTTDTSRTFTLGSGTLNLNGKTLSTGLFSSSNSNTRTINFNSGIIEVTGSGTAWYTATSTNLTLSGVGTISMTSASAKTFAGGGKVYSTLNQGGAGALSITGANTFNNITNTVQPATISFPASTTTSFYNFELSGTSGNLITLNSTTSGTQATLNNIGTTFISVSNCNIQDTNATGASGWQAYFLNGNLDSGNNTGWLFVSFLATNNIIFAEFVRVTTPSATYRFASTPSALTIPAVDSQPFNALGTLIKVGEAQQDIKSTANETTFTLVGIDTAMLGWVLGQEIKGSKIEAWHGFFDANGALITQLGTGGLTKFFTGYINSFSISEQWMEEIRQFVGIITVSASSIQLILKNRIAGRYTNDNNWQFFNSGDTSMNRVAYISTVNYYFGKGASANS